MMNRLFAVVLIILNFCLHSTVHGDNNPYAPDVPEPGSVEAIAQDTTNPSFVSPLVSYIPDSDTVPSPTDFLGHIAGAAGELARTEQIYGYFRELDRASDRVHVEVIGKTFEGREIILAAIADEEGIRNLNQLKAATAALADPRRTNPEQAAKMIQDARPIYYFNCAIHADESISPDMSMELAYRLAVSEHPMIQRIRKEIVVLINPVSNPDGRDKMADWYYRFIKGKNDYDLLPRQSPPYWGRYVFVDANRDAHQLTMPETQAVAKMFFDFHPTVIHDLHEAIPLLETWNGTGPYNPNLDPIVLSEFLEMSFHEMSTMSAYGMPGVWTWKFGEGFGHHYMDSVAMNHNAIGRGYETFGNAVPETVTRKLDPPDVKREWYRPWPPERTFVWSHRDGLNYAETGSLAILDYTARNADQLLHNFYQKGYNSWQKGKEGNPYAFVIPAEQEDRGRVAVMINRLLAQDIEVHSATRAFETGGRKYPVGTFIVRLDQPYRNYAVDLLLPQEFPKDAEYEPYDDISWSFPVHFGVTTLSVNEVSILQVPMKKVVSPLQPSGSVYGSGPVFLMKDTGQEALLAARYRLSDFDVEIAEQSFSEGSVTYPAGSWILPAQTGLPSRLKKVAEELGLDFQSVTSAPRVQKHPASVPRLGIWVPWADTDMIGWIRYTLDQRKVPYTYVRDEDIRAGDLKKKVDVIVYGNVLLDVMGQIHGIEQKSGPMPFRKTTETPSHGTPAESDDITGGIGYEGLANLEAFVKDGGLLITLGRGSELVLETGMVRNIRQSGLRNVTTPGAEIRTRFLRVHHPVAYGYPEITSAFRSNYTVYDPPRRWMLMSYCTSCLDGPFDLSNVVMQWGVRPFDTGETLPVSESESQPMIISGGGRNVEEIEGYPAILDVPTGNGHILVFNFNPMHREMNYSDFRFLWNGILNWKYIVDGLPMHDNN